MVRAGTDEGLVLPGEKKAKLQAVRQFKTFLRQRVRRLPKVPVLQTLPQTPEELVNFKDAYADDPPAGRVRTDRQNADIYLRGSRAEASSSSSAQPAQQGADALRFLGQMLQDALFGGQRNHGADNLQNFHIVKPRQKRLSNGSSTQVEGDTPPKALCDVPEDSELKETPDKTSALPQNTSTSAPAEKPPASAPAEKPPASAPAEKPPASALTPLTPSAAAVAVQNALQTRSRKRAAQSEEDSDGQDAPTKKRPSTKAKPKKSVVKKDKKVEPKKSVVKKDKKVEPKESVVKQNKQVGKPVEAKAARPPMMEEGQSTVMFLEGKLHRNSGGFRAFAHKNDRSDRKFSFKTRSPEEAWEAALTWIEGNQRPKVEDVD